MEQGPTKLTTKIRNSAEFVASTSLHITIDYEKIKEFVLSNECSNIPKWGPCHIDPDSTNLENLIAYVCVIDSLNFCFWPVPGDLEYDQLVQSVNDLLKNKKEFFTSQFLIDLKVDNMKVLFKCFENCPQLVERVRSLNELGWFCKLKLNSKFENLLEVVKYDCVELVELLSKEISAFRDETLYKGKQIFFYKRAQILTADLYSALSEMGKPIKLSRIEEITMFADYRVPQILRELGIFCYGTSISEKIDKKIEILANTEEEIEIRGATIHVVEEIKKQIKILLKKELCSYQIDFVLWTAGEEKRLEMRPHHRTLSIFY